MPVQEKPNVLDESKSLRVFLVSISLVAALCISGGFLGMAMKDRRLIQGEMLNRARRDFANIVLMRHWNAGYGGVFVEKRPGVTSNAYLDNPDIMDTKGRVYTKKNPALMTRELSELVKKDQGYGFHITSLRPLNPQNRPDARESEALLDFEKGSTEKFWRQNLDGVEHFRYMAPLKVEASCLPCHAKQGYALGEIRGGISVSFEVGELESRLRQNLRLVVGFALLTTLLMLTFITLLFRQLVSRLREARTQLETLATTDALTGLWNRRVILDRLEEEQERHRRSGEALTCLMLDVDHFKRVNDRFGHLAGDQVLRELAAALKATLRTYDIVGRYGGEEFLVVLPGTDLETGRLTAERVRVAVATSLRVGAPEGVREPITVSLGLAEMYADETVNQLLIRADLALYRAKLQGRDQVETEG